MLFIGITGGVGAGKSAILSYIEETYHAKILLADEIAHDLMEPQAACYEQLLTLFAEDDVFLNDGHIDRPKMAQVLFSNKEKLEALNKIVHPAVKNAVLQTVTEERKKAQLDCIIFEAALLIEEGYDQICDEMWYIYTSEEQRRARLAESRGYSQEKITSILKHQLSEGQFRTYCQVEIDNNGTPEESFIQIDEVMEHHLIEKR